MRVLGAIPSWLSAAAATTTVLAGLGALFVVHALPYGGYVTATALMVGLGVLALLYLAWQVEPAWLFTAAIIASTFNSNWGAFGFPGGFAPDRLILLGAMLALLLRSRGSRDRPTLEFRPLHIVFALTVLWAVGSGIAAHTLFSGNAPFTVLDRMAVPFAVFVLSPLAFRTRRQRQIFLGAFVVFGAYLGLTTLFETIGPHALVFPRFILSPAVGAALHEEEGRGRGPFLEAAANGMGLYVCAVSAGVAIATWRRPWARAGAAAVIVLCVLGVLFTLTRSVWVASAAGTAVALLATPGLRRFLLPAVAGVTVIVLATLALAPSFNLQFEQRSTEQRSVWERQNVDAAAVSMVAARPLLGFGLGTFNAENSNYFPLLGDVPQVAEQRLAVHNIYLSMAVELGLIGATLFVLSFLGAIGSAVLSRAPPELRPWRVGLLAIAVFWSVVACFSPFGEVFPSMITWLWAGIVVGGSFVRVRAAPSIQPVPTAHSVPSPG